ncbi:MAG: M56 family metallopeptidase [Bryobacteraceae bacterium]|jgi:hypothetical protein
MTTIQFLAEWGLRSSILILSGAALLWALRVKDPGIRLTAWTAMLFGSLAIPALTAALPKVPLAMVRLAAPRVAARPVVEPVAVPGTAPEPVGLMARQNTGSAKPGKTGIARFDWARAAVTIYGLAALALVLRVSAGLAIGLRVLRSSRATGRSTAGIEIRESDRVAAPVTLGIARPAIVLPGDWRQWAGAKLDAVLAHERSHIRRHDPAVQLLSAIHRALLWYSPLSWFLHRRIVRVAEEASDDAAVAASGDRALYAEVLLDFMQGSGGRLVRRAGWLAVPMSRYGRPDERIHRILDGTALSRGVTGWSAAAILAIGSPLAYVVAAAGPDSAPPARAATAPAASVQAAPERPAALEALRASREVSASPKAIVSTTVIRTRQLGQNFAAVSVGAIPSGTLTSEKAMEIRHKLLTLPYYTIFDDLAFQMNGSVVTLTGACPPEPPWDMRYAAAKVVIEMPDITQVINNIKLLPMSQMDWQIRRAEAQAIYGDPQIGMRYGYQALPSIHIIVDNGRVTLEGVVDNQSDEALVRTRAKAVPNVISVTDNLIVMQGFGGGSLGSAANGYR